MGQALGVDRVIEALQERQPELLPSIPGPDLFLVAADPAGFAQIGQILPQLLALPITLDWTPSRSGVGNQLKHAAKVKAKAALIVGEQEVQSQIYSLKWLESGQQESVTLSSLGQKFNQ